MTDYYYIINDNKFDSFIKDNNNYFDNNYNKNLSESESEDEEIFEVPDEEKILFLLLTKKKMILTLNNYIKNNAFYSFKQKKITFLYKYLLPFDFFNHENRIMFNNIYKHNLYKNVSVFLIKFIISKKYKTSFNVFNKYSNLIYKNHTINNTSNLNYSLNKNNYFYKNFDKAYLLLSNFKYKGGRNNFDFKVRKNRVTNMRIFNKFTVLNDKDFKKNNILNANIFYFDNLNKLFRSKNFNINNQLNLLNKNYFSELFNFVKIDYDFNNKYYNIFSKSSVLKINTNILFRNEFFYSFFKKKLNNLNNFKETNLSKFNYSNDDIFFYSSIWEKVNCKSKSLSKSTCNPTFLIEVKFNYYFSFNFNENYFFKNNSINNFFLKFNSSYKSVFLKTKGNLKKKNLFLSYIFLCIRNIIFLNDIHEISYIGDFFFYKKANFNFTKKLIMKLPRNFIEDIDNSLLINHTKDLRKNLKSDVYYYNNHYPIFFLKNKYKINFFSNFKKNFNSDYLSFFHLFVINNFELVLKKKIYLNITTNKFKNYKDMFYIEMIYSQYKGLKFNFLKKTDVSDFIEIIWYSFLFKDLTMLSNWVTKLMELLNFKTHRRFLVFFSNFMYKYAYVFIEVLRIKGFFFDIRGKVGVTGNSKKRHTFIKIGKLSKSAKKIKIDFNQNLVRTPSGVLGLTYILSY